MGEIAYKLCVFGESGVGKTTLARRYLTGYFEEDIKLTMGAELFVKYITIEKIRVVLQIWDFGGEDDFNFLLPLYSKGSSGGIFMFDLNNKQSINRIDKWIDLFKQGTNNNEKTTPILMVGGKLDLIDNIEITESEIEKIAKDYNLLRYIKCSSKTGENVEAIFLNLVRDILKIQKII